MCFLPFCPAFQIKINKLQKTIQKYLLNIETYFNILSDIIPTKHNLT